MGGGLSQAERSMKTKWAPHMGGFTFSYLSGGTTALGGLCRYCLKRSSKAWPTVLMTLCARPSQHSRM